MHTRMGMEEGVWHSVIWTHALYLFSQEAVLFTTVLSACHALQFCCSQDDSRYLFGMERETAALKNDRCMNGTRVGMGCHQNRMGMHCMGMPRSGYGLGGRLVPWSAFCRMYRTRLHGAKLLGTWSFHLHEIFSLCFGCYMKIE